MNKATFIASLDEDNRWYGDSRLYKLDEPITITSLGVTFTTPYIVVMATTYYPDDREGICIYLTNQHGDVINHDFRDWHGSNIFVKSLDHAVALSEIGIVIKG